MLCHQRLDFKFKKTMESVKCTQKNHDNEQNHNDLVINEQQDMPVCEDIYQVDGKAQQTTVINIDDHLSTDDDNL